MARSYKRDSRGRFAGGGGPGGSKGSKGSSGGRKSSGGAKTTTARGRALANQRRASDKVRAGRGGKGPSKKAVRSAVTAMRARAFYASTGTGTKRSTKKAVSATTKGRQVRAEARGKGKTAREVVKGRKKAGGNKTPKVSTEQRRIATEYKKQINTRNIRATRRLLRMVAKDQGYTGKNAIRDLTRSMSFPGASGQKPTPLPLRLQRGNAYSAYKSKDLGLNRRFSDTLWRDALSANTDRANTAWNLADSTLSGPYTKQALRASARQGRRRR